MTKTEHLILILLSNQNSLNFERLKEARCNDAFISGADCQRHSMERSMAQIAELLDKPHEPEDIEKLYQKEFIKKLFNEADEIDVVRFLKEIYIDLGGDPDELH